MDETTYLDRIYVDEGKGGDKGFAAPWEIEGEEDEYWLSDYGATKMEKGWDFMLPTGTVKMTLGWSTQYFILTPDGRWIRLRISAETVKKSDYRGSVTLELPTGHKKKFSKRTVEGVNVSDVWTLASLLKSKKKSKRKGARR